MISRQRRSSLNNDDKQLLYWFLNREKVIQTLEIILISLTSCLYKTLDGMVNNCLIWYLESNKLMTGLQYDFRKYKYKNTMGRLVWLVSFIREVCFYKNRTWLLYFLTWKRLMKLTGNTGSCEILITSDWKLSYQNSLRVSSE